MATIASYTLATAPIVVKRAPEVDGADYGQDYNTLMPDGTLDLDLSFTQITGHIVPIQRVIRRGFTPRGKLFWAPDVGARAGSLSLSDSSPRQLQTWETRLENEANQVDGVRRSRVSLVASDDGDLMIKAKLTLQTGVFELKVVAADALRILVGRG